MLTPCTIARESGYGTQGDREVGEDRRARHVAKVELQPARGFLHGAEDVVGREDLAEAGEPGTHALKFAVPAARDPESLLPIPVVPTAAGRIAPTCGALRFGGRNTRRTASFDVPATGGRSDGGGRTRRKRELWARSVLRGRPRFAFSVAIRRHR